MHINVILINLKFAFKRKTENVGVREYFIIFIPKSMTTSYFKNSYALERGFDISGIMEDLDD